MTKDEVLYCRHSQVIRDPFPDLTASWGFLRFFDNLAYARLKCLGMPSPWTAYQKGYDKAYEEILARCSND